MNIMDPSNAYRLLICCILCQGHLCNMCRSGKCLRCPAMCETCDSESSCKECKPGFYGIACSEKCQSYCINNNCNKFSGLCSACEKTFFLSTDSLCIRCPVNCLYCRNKERCFKCVTGFWGGRCHKNCINCKPGTSCDENSGHCFVCKTGLSGQSCDTNCNPKCKSCKRLEKDKCTICSPGRYGEDCHYDCSSNCLEVTCNRTDGSCTRGCLTGYWGSICNNKCDAFCRDSQCSRLDGNCTLLHKDTGNGVILTYIGVSVVVLAVVAAFVVTYLMRSGKLLKAFCVRSKEKEHSTPTSDREEGSDDESGYEKMYLMLATDETKQKGSGSARLQRASQRLRAYYIDDIDRTNAYLGCKEPKTDDDFSEFWEMIWSECCCIIVMFSETYEELSGAIYCPEVNKEETYGNVRVKTLDLLYKDKYARRVLEVKQERETRTVFHLQWCFSCSLDVQELIECRASVKSEASDMYGPLLIHSSDGESRCGPYIAMDMYLTKWESGQTISMSDYIDNIQKQNCNLLRIDDEKEFLNEVLTYYNNENGENDIYEDVQCFFETDTSDEF